MKKRVFQERFYRRWVKTEELTAMRVVVGESDLSLYLDRLVDAGMVEHALKELRSSLQSYIQAHPEFATSLSPIEVEGDSPPIVREMAWAGRIAGVGPMAAVAGAIAQYLGQFLCEYCQEVIIENGGDIYLRSRKERLVGIFAGDSFFTGKLAVKIRPETTPCGICTSSGTVGHSLSFGKADAGVIVAENASLADAVATAVTNRIQVSGDLGRLEEFLRPYPGVRGAVAIMGSQLSAWGEIELVET